MPTDPYKIAPDTWIVPEAVPVPTFGMLPCNSMVIVGKEPVLVETGLPIFRKEFLEKTWAIVDPADVRWIFVSHEDRDHAGNVAQVLELCPNAQFVTNFIGLGKLSEEFHIPIERVHLAPDKHSFDIGDRQLVTIRPPLYDSPSTRGVYDPKNELYYAADAYGAVLNNVPEFADEIPASDMADGFNFMNRANHVWHALADPLKVDSEIDRIRDLEAKMIVSAHGPVWRTDITKANDMLSQIPRMEALPDLTHEELEARIAAAEAEAKKAEPN